MLYFLSSYTNWFAGFNIFRYITFRAGMAAVTAFLLCVVLGPVFIRLSRKRRIKETAKRGDAPALDQFQDKKEGTPTMGGVFIIGSVLISVLLWANLGNQFILITSFICQCLAIVGGA